MTGVEGEVGSRGAWEGKGREEKGREVGMEMQGML